MQKCFAERSYLKNLKRKTKKVSNDLYFAITFLDDFTNTYHEFNFAL